ncbi:MAG: hypothetical protein JSU68_04125 [Phycisphaerales bacterium]|nr:MAG: hypothetical protein JSU68_04125 [Phycisphaerales bacterium]
MTIIPKPVKRTDEPADEIRRISTPGRHEVTITGWDFRDRAGARDVVFDVCNDDGARQSVEFGLSQLELSTGELSRFLATVLRREHSRPQWMSSNGFLHMLFNHVVGRRVILHVMETSRGAQIVVDWESPPSDTPQPAPAQSQVPADSGTP